MTRWPRTADDALTVILLMLLAATFVQALVNVVDWSSAWPMLGAADPGSTLSLLRQLVDVLLALVVPLVVVVLLRLPLTAPAGLLVALPAALWPVPSILLDAELGAGVMVVALVNCAITLAVPPGVFALLGQVRKGRHLSAVA